MCVCQNVGVACVWITFVATEKKGECIVCVCVCLVDIQGFNQNIYKK